MAKLAVKKIHCPTCEKLVRVKEKKAGDRLEFTCVKCNKTVWQKKGLRWKYQKEE